MHPPLRTPLGTIVRDLADFDFAPLVGLDDRFHDRLGGGRVGYFGDGERAFVDLRDAGPVSYTHLDVYKRQPVLY